MVKKRQKLFSFNNISITTKSVVSSVLAMLAMLPLWIIGFLLKENSMLIMWIIVSLVNVVWYLYFWGWISNKLWNWK